MRRARWDRGALGAGLAGTLACALGAVWSPQHVLAAWLAAFTFWIGVPLGALALMQIHDLAGGRWALTLGRGHAAALAILPLLILAFIPILFALPALYPWARPDEARYLANTFYLNTPFFIARCAGYFVLWAALALLAFRRSASDRADPSGAGGGLSALGLLLLAVTVTFAAFDWVMSLEPHWSSTMFGLIVGSGQFTTGLAFAILVALGTKRESLPGEGPLADRFEDLGSLLLAVILLWAYFEFMQFLIIWEENLKGEIGWYLKRLEGGWGAVAVAIAAGHFIIPFLALIWSPVKRNRAALGAICALLMLTGLVNAWWMVLPEFRRGFTWFDPLAAIGMGGLCFATLLWRLEAKPALAEGDAPRRDLGFGRKLRHG
ncbi:MAG: hypothetical protein JO010_13300 [Alphaproteobacteria bacterium]|nr:hypothetical protein [Alphaproteobacteria bacterium]